MDLAGELGYVSLTAPVSYRLPPPMSTSNNLSSPPSNRIVLVECREVQPISAANSLTCHLSNEVVPIPRVFEEPLERNLFRAEGILARAIYLVGQVLIPSAGQRGIELRHGHADKVIHIIHTCFEIGDRQMPHYVAGM